MSTKKGADIKNAVEAARERAKKAAQTAPGAVFTVEDLKVNLPTPDGEQRTFHNIRRVIIVSPDELNKSASPRTVLVVPCSASQGCADFHDYELPDGEPGIGESGVVAYASLVQPLLKEHLKDRQGVIRRETLDEIHAAILANLGIVARPRVALPPREDVAVSGVMAAPGVISPAPAAAKKE